MYTYMYVQYKDNIHVIICTYVCTLLVMHVILMGSMYVQSISARVCSKEGGRFLSLCSGTSRSDIIIGITFQYIHIVSSTRTLPLVWFKYVCRYCSTSQTNITDEVMYYCACTYVSFVRIIIDAARLVGMHRQHKAALL